MNQESRNKLLSSLTVTGYISSRNKVIRILKDYHLEGCVTNQIHAGKQEIKIQDSHCVTLTAPTSMLCCCHASINAEMGGGGALFHYSDCSVGFSI